MSTRALSRNAFIAWLNTKHSRTKAGLACEQDFCPLAKFLTQTTGQQYIVDGSSYGVATKQEDGTYELEYQNEIELPNWAVEFVNAVDANQLDGYDSVSVGRALTIVENSNIGRGRVHNF